MKSPRQEYLERANSLGILPLGPLHHHVMDRVFRELRDGFSFDDVLHTIEADDAVTNHPSIDNTALRVKLVVIRALDSLVEVGMLNQVPANERRYSFNWNSI